MKTIIVSLATLIAIASTPAIGQSETAAERRYRAEMTRIRLTQHVQARQAQLHAEQGAYRARQAELRARAMFIGH